MRQETRQARLITHTARHTDQLHAVVELLQVGVHVVARVPAPVHELLQRQQRHRHQTEPAVVHGHCPTTQQANMLMRTPGSSASNHGTLHGHADAQLLIVVVEAEVVDRALELVTGVLLQWADNRVTRSLQSEAKLSNARSQTRRSARCRLHRHKTDR